MHCKLLRTRAFSLAICALWLTVAGCKKKAPEEAVPSASAVPVSAPPAPPRCREAEPGKAFTLGEGAARAPAPVDAEDDAGPSDEPGLPFAVEVGGAVATSDGFAVAAVVSKAGKSTAVVAWLDGAAGRGRLADVGKLHGDSDPPELAADGDDVLALMHDTDGRGELLRVVAVRPGPKQLDVVVGAEIVETRDESRAADIALGKERGVAIWDGWDKVGKHGVIRVASFARSDVSSVTRPRVISGKHDDAESPRLARRSGGYWAAWITRSVEAPEKARPAPAASGVPVSDPSLVEMGARFVTVVPLDENGAALAEPKAVSSKDEHVLVFDLATGPDGAAWIAWREEATVPGAEERRVRIARVKLDGSAQLQAFDDEQVGVGVPALLVDVAPGKRTPTPWISLGSVSDETRLAALGPDGALLDALGGEPVVRSAEPLALARGRMLIARPRGLAVELSVVECAPGPKP